MAHPTSSAPARVVSGQARPGAGSAPGARLTGLLWIAAGVSAISALLYGYDTGIISGALLQIRRQFHTSSTMEQVIAASILLGAVIGALTGSQLSERWGRRRTILLLSCVFAVGALAASLSPSTWTLSLSRVVLGFAVGGATQTVPMFVAELAPKERRGRLVLTFQVGIGVGIVVATLVGASQFFSWRLSIGLATGPALLMLILMLGLPESPRWLVKHDQQDTARRVLERIRAGGADIESELDGIIDVEEQERRA
ncbi:MAG: MFS transporter, partial [Streptosporangiaceae bacterium]|nr:MFS transporter [Streptosporangiaceae bacterium]